MAVRITQAGVALTVGIIVLIGLIIGGLFWVKQSGEQARRDEAVKIAEEKREGQSGDDVALNGESPDPTKQNGSEGAPNTDDTTNNGANENQTADEMTQAGPSSNVESATELPQTGPADAVGVVILGGVTFVAVAYSRSRRALLEAL